MKTLEEELIEGGVRESREEDAWRVTLDWNHDGECSAVFVEVKKDPLADDEALALGQFLIERLEGAA